MTTIKFHLRPPDDYRPSTAYQKHMNKQIHETRMQNLWLKSKKLTKIIFSRKKP